MPDRTSRPGPERRPQYELPNEYGAPRPSGTGAPSPEGHDFDDDHALDAEGSVRAVHRDEPVDEPAELSSSETESVAAAAAAAEAPLTRQEFVQQRSAEKTSWRAKRSARSPRRKWAWRIAGIAVVLVMVPLLYSLVDHLRQPGTDSMAVRTVEWVRDNGGNGIVNTIERWWYTNNPPPTGGTPDEIEVQGTSGEVAEGSGPTATTLPVKPVHLPAPTARVSTPAPVVEANEGVWMPVGRQVGGLPAEYITFVRPDAAHTSYYTALMWLDTKLLRAQYVPGLQEPGGGPNPWGSQVPPEVRGTLIAAFNSGFKMDQARGGVYFGGQEVRGLVPGAASIVVFKDGTASVGVWGRDFTMGPDIESVRQNLELLVDNGGGPVGVGPNGTTPIGAPGGLNPALQENDTNAFGATLGNNVYVWRSGVGVTATGALVYAGGPAMSVVSLAKTLQNAGAVRAMELDINTDWVSAYTFVNENAADPNSPVIGIKLGGDMSRSGDRYLQPGERDFFAFFAEPEYATGSSSSSTTTTTPPTTTTTTKKR